MWTGVSCPITTATCDSSVIFNGTKEPGRSVKRTPIVEHVDKGENKNCLGLLSVEVIFNVTKGSPMMVSSEKVNTSRLTNFCFGFLFVNVSHLVNSVNVPVDQGTFYFIHNSG